MGFLTSRKRVWVLACLLAGVFQIIFCSNLLAEEITKGQDKINQDLVGPFFGTYSTEIPVEVPEFHGLEPKLQLVYNSSGGNGLLGIGWDLAGVSYIERGQPNHGAPKYDATDVYFLDGIELVPNTAATPCPQGDYCTEIKNYARVMFIDNTWCVWGTNGNKATYSPVFVTSGGTFRWYLTSLQDPRGNAVNYSYVNDGANFWYLDTITYDYDPSVAASDLTTITFYRESRNDVISVATGVGIGRMNQRLKTIAVTTMVESSENMVRAYALDYDYSAKTGTSRLTVVQQFGNDARIDDDGVVAGGTALPPVSMAYTAEQTEPSEKVGPECSDISSYNIYSHTVGDVNGDGKTDLIFMGNTADQTYISNGDGTFTHYSHGHGEWNYVAYNRDIGDVN